MFKAVQGKEIVIEKLNEIGVLADIARTVSEKGISIRATAGWVAGVNGVIRLVTDDNLRAMEALIAKKFQPHEVDVVLTEVPHKPGLLKHLAERLGPADISIHHLYATSSSDSGKCLIVFSSTDNDKALVVLNK